MIGSEHMFKLRQTIDLLWSELESDRRKRPGAGLLTTELHISTPEGELRLALGQDGDRHLLVPVPFNADLAEDTRSAGVRLRRRDLVFASTPGVFVDLECRRSDLTTVFTGLTADVCERISSTDEEASLSVVHALDEWRALLGVSRRPWSAELVAGLHGELIVLERVLVLDAGRTGLWTGPSGTPHDFHSVHHALEVKTTTRATGRVVRIHGVDQLERPHQGALTLAWFRILPSATGRTLAERIAACVDAADIAGPVMSMLDQLDLPAAEDPLMCEHRFELIEERWLDVDETFPRVTPDMFALGAVPAGVAGVEYSCDLDIVATWEEDGAITIARLVADL